MTLAVIGSGMATSVGYNSPASCAAIRCGLNRFEETRFRFGGEWIVGASIPLPGEPRGIERQLTLAVMVIEETLAQLPPGPVDDTAWVVCLSEPDRPGRPAGLDKAFADELHVHLRDAARLGRHSRLLTGRLSAVHGLQWLEEAIGAGAAAHGILAAVDGYLHTATLAALEAEGRLLSTVNSDGLVPGEAAGAIIVSAPREVAGQLQCLGVGWASEPATTGSGLPLRGEGLAAAIRSALSVAGLAGDGCGFAHLDYRIADLSGEHHDSREAALALARTMRVRKAEFELWQPADCIGHVGVAAIPIALGLAFDASRRGYAPGPGVLTHFGDDDGGRAVIALREFGRPSRPPLN